MVTKDDIPDYAPVTIEPNADTRITIRIEPDEDVGPPWEEHDGHGIVSGWTRRDKAPGEIVLASDAGRYRYYDFAGSVKIARRDGWGADGVTKGERAHRAALADYRRLKDWCEDRWRWIGVVVEVERCGRIKKDSLWGIESDGDYWREVAAELANGMLDAAEMQGALEMMPEDYTCGCGLYVHPSRRNPDAVHISDCEYRIDRCSKRRANG
jgi:hypothetical protein